MDETIVGMGRVGGALAALGPATTVRRGEVVPEGQGPIYVCTRNDDLEAVLAATPTSRRADLVFVQNGVIDDWLAERGLAGNTRALLYIAVASRGDAPVDGGRSVVTGPWAEALAARMARGGLALEVVDRPRFDREMVEKLLWICVHGVVCDRHQTTVGQVASAHADEVRALTAELAALMHRALGIPADDGLADRLLAYSRSIPDYRAAVKEWRWRNGWLIQREATPLHTAWLTELGHLPAT